VIRIVNNVQHQVILLFLGTLFSTYLKLTGLGRVLLAGIPMKVSTGKPAREPDLLIVFAEHYDRIQRTSLQGPADIVVEIVSPESDGRDHGDKLVEYELAGVREYWLLDPLRQASDVYALGENGRYQRLPLDAQGRVYSQLMSGFAFDPALLWRDEPPVGVEVVELVQAMVAG
jgi:Uma2 family endonuclease